jgi:hypothetical protein
MGYKNEMTQSIAELEQGIGLNKGFFISLLNEDDWSFIIKLHALYEAAISSLITEKIGQSELNDFIAKLELGGPKGKMALAQKLGLLDREEIAFIQKLSEIRNDLVHYVGNTNIKLESYLAEKNDKYFKTLGYSYKEMIDIDGISVNSIVFIKENPKIAIWQNSLNVLAIISCLIATENSKQESRKLIIKIHEALNKRGCK